MLWPDLVPDDLTGDQLTGPQFLYLSKVAHPRDGAAKKEFFGFAFNASGLKVMIFYHCDRGMHRIHQSRFIFLTANADRRAVSFTLAY